MSPTTFVANLLGALRGRPKPLTPRVRQDRQPFRILGPHFYWDLIRLARRGRSTSLRVFYALFLLTGLFLVYANRVSNQRPPKALFEPDVILRYNELADVAEIFVRAILVLQTVAVFVLTPAYVASAIAEEREGKTLDLLFSTHLSDREIVFGKLFARLTHLAGILLTGLPILSFTLFFGGVDMDLLLTGFAYTLLSLFGVGCLCILVSAQSRTVASAVTTAYALTFGMALTAFSIVAAVRGLYSPETALIVYGVMNLLMALAILPNAVRALRGAPETENLHSAMRKALELPAPPVPERGPTLAFRPTKPVGTEPLLWKETNFPRLADNPVEGMLIGVLVIIVYIFLLWTASQTQPDLPSACGTLLRVLLLVSAGFLTSAVAFRTASSVVRERHSRTLECLLTLPVSRTEILVAKCLGNILRWRVLVVIAGSLLVLGLISLRLHPLAFLLFPAALAIHVGALASAGILLSTLARTPLWANAAMGVLMLAFYGAALWVGGGA